MIKRVSLLFTILVTLTFGSIQDAQVTSAALQYGCWNSNGVYCTAASFGPEYFQCNPSCPSVFIRATYPSRSCRWRVFYRITGSGNDYHSEGKLANPSFWYDIDGSHRDYDDYAWPLIGTKVAGAFLYDIQVQCGGTWADYAWAYVTIQVNSP